MLHRRKKSTVKSMQTTSERMAPLDETTLNARSLLIDTLAAQEKYAEVDAMDMAMLRDFEIAKAKKEEDTAMVTLAWLDAESKGGKKEAEKHVNAEAVVEALWEDKDESRMYAEHILFNAYMQAHRYNAAEKICRDLLAVNGPHDQQTIMVAGDLGSVHLAQKKCNAAVKELAENLTHRELQFGLKDSRTLFTAANLARAMHGMSDKKALPLMLETVETMREKYGTELYIIVFTNHLVIMLFECARYDEAINLHRDVSKLAIETLGANHPTSIWIRSTHNPNKE